MNEALPAIITEDDLVDPPFPFELFKNRDREWLLRFFCQFWDLDGQFVIGKIRRVKLNYFLVDVCNTKWARLSYPIQGLLPVDTLEAKGIIIGRSVDAEEGDYVQACIDIARNWEANRSPINLLSIPAATIRGLHLAHIPAEQVGRDEYGNFLVDEALQKAFLRSRQEALRNELAVFLKQEEAPLRADLLAERQALEAAVELGRDERNRLKTELDREQQRLDGMSIEIDSKAEKLIRLNVDLATKKQELNEAETAKMQAGREREAADRERDDLHTMIDLLRSEEEKVVQQARETVTKLRSWGLVGNDISKEFDSEEEPKSPIDSMFDGDYVGLIDRVQGYLYRHRDLVYPKHLLLDFLTLLRMNDFIVLAGQPGSGKTQLVKSFALAIGAHAEVIAVKPNWTSSEDLLGYWNGVHNRYQSTQFLDTLKKAVADPSRLYLICLDEMNLAHVEYYLADFLSALEERKGERVLTLFAGSEADRAFKLVASVMKQYGQGASDLASLLGQAIGDVHFAAELKQIIGEFDKPPGGFNEKNLLLLADRLRQEISGTFTIPDNVRIIGAINIDETTQNLSPKVLDRAHIVRIESPISYFEQYRIEAERNSPDYEVVGQRLLYSDLNSFRGDYPPFDASSELTEQLTVWSEKYFRHFSASASMRTLRQAQYYRKLMLEYGTRDEVILNNVLRHKFLPRFSIDLSKSVTTNKGTSQKLETLLASCRKELRDKVGEDLFQDTERITPCVEELDTIREAAKNNGGVANYWT